MLWPLMEVSVKVVWKPKGWSWNSLTKSLWCLPGVVVINNNNKIDFGNFIVDMIKGLFFLEFVKWVHAIWFGSLIYCLHVDRKAL